MELSRAEQIKTLKQIGYDDLRIREVMRTHPDFNSALEALRHETSARMQEELRKYDISPITIERLTQRFQSTQKALSCYNEYMSHSKSMRRSLYEFGFSILNIQSCIDNLLSLDDAINELIPQQGSVSSPTAVPLFDMHSTSSIRNASIINNPPTLPVVIPGNIPRNPAGMPVVGSQLSPSHINNPQIPVRSNGEEAKMRSTARIEHASTSSSRRSNDAIQSNRRIQLPHLYEEGSLIQSVESEVVGRSDSQVSITIHNSDSMLFDTNTVNRQSIGANAEETYKNLMAVPEPDGPLEYPIHSLRLLLTSARGGILVAQKSLIEILTNIFQSEGVSEHTLQTFNPVIFQDTMNCKDCAICLDNFANGEEIIVLPCGHPFHSEGISTWLGMSKRCPICRANLDDLYLANILY